MTGDPHTDARLEAWRPERATTALPDQLPEPGRERRARLALLVLAALAALLLLAYVTVAIVSSGALGPTS